MLVTEELARAVRTESVVALMYWFGVSHNTVCAWRRAFDVGQWGPEGSRRLHLQNSAARADALRDKRQPKEMIRKRLRTRQERGARPGNRWGEDGWTAPAASPLCNSASRVARRYGRARARPTCVKMKP